MPKPFRPLVAIVVIVVVMYGSAIAVRSVMNRPIGVPAVSQVPVVVPDATAVLTVQVGGVEGRVTRFVRVSDTHVKVVVRDPWNSPATDVGEVPAGPVLRIVDRLFDEADRWRVDGPVPPVEDRDDDVVVVSAAGEVWLFTSTTRSLVDDLVGMTGPRS